MKKRILAVVCMLAILMSMIALTSSAATYVCYIGNTGYTSLAKAITAYNGGVIRLDWADGISAAQTISKDVVIDLNGCTLSSTFTATNGAKLYLMDSLTDDYKLSAEDNGRALGKFTGRVSGSTFAALPAGAGVTEHNDGYVMLGDSANGFTFHRFTFNTVVSNPFFTTTVAFDSQVGKSVTEYGVVIGTQPNPTKENNLITSAKVNSSAVVTIVNAGMDRVVLNSEDHLQNYLKARTDIQLYGRAYYVLDGVTYYNEQLQTTCNLKNDVEALNARWDSATEKEKLGAYKLLMDNVDVMRYWKVSNIRQSGLCPDEWTNVVDQAMNDGQVHYYFMYCDNVYYADDDVADGVGNKWGDCCLIAFPDGTTMLVDTARYEYLPTLIKNLKRMGITKIDHLVISHGDPDHFGGVTNASGVRNMIYDGGIADYFEIGEVYYPDLSNNSYVAQYAAIYKDLKPYFLKKGFTEDQLHPVLAGDTIQVGTNGTMEVLWPTAEGTAGDINNSGKPYTVQNDNSMVMRLDWDKHSSLFTGDIFRADVVPTETNQQYSSGAEKDVLALYTGTTKLQVDLLKVPHHGQNTSSGNGNSTETGAGTNFVKAVSAIYAVATGFTNPNENASGNVDGRYSAVGTTLLRDYTLGYIHVAAKPDTDAMTYDASK